MRKNVLMILAVLSSSAFADNLMDKFFSHCDRVVDKQPVFKSCYDYNLKGTTAVAYTVDGAKLNDAEVHIKKRPQFYAENSIPVKYRSLPEDYTRSGYDRGHMANHADFDYSANLVYMTYSMANIVPQNPELNRGEWAKLEKFERRLAKSFGSINVINVVTYSNSPQRIGRSKIAVPDGFYKIIYNNTNLMQCYYYKNQAPVDNSYKSHEVACSSVISH